MERGDTKKQGMQSQWELGAGNVRACSNEFASACNSGGPDSGANQAIHACYLRGQYGAVNRDKLF